MRAATIAPVFAFVQILTGALMRHLGAGLACTDLPLCQGGLWPSGAHPNVLLHAGHRLFAVVVFAVACWVAAVAWRTTRHRTARLLATCAPLLVLAQGVLGWLSISSFLDVVPVTAHLGVAALLLADLVALRLVAAPPRQIAAFDLSSRVPRVSPIELAA